MHISSIKIENFQGHKKLFLEFNQSITTIIGASDVGKSSVIRAIYWVCFNKPSGTSFIHHGSLRTAVTLNINGVRIKRVRSDKENAYYIDKKKYVAFGNDVPFPVQEALCISQINFQLQHESIYWFSESPGQVSRNLNEIINLDIMDTALKNIASTKRECQSNLTIISQRLKKLDSKNRGLAFVTGLKKQAKKIKSVHNTIQSLNLPCMRLGIKQVIALANQIKRAQGLNGVADECITVGEVLQNRTTRLLLLTKYTEAIKSKTHYIGKVFNKLEITGEQLTLLIKHEKQLKELLGKIKKVDPIKKKELETLNKKLEGKICPLCLNKVKR